MCISLYYNICFYSLFFLASFVFACRSRVRTTCYHIRYDLFMFVLFCLHRFYHMRQTKHGLVDFYIALPYNLDARKLSISIRTGDDNLDFPIHKLFILKLIPWLVEWSSFFIILWIPLFRNSKGFSLDIISFWIFSRRSGMANTNPLHYFQSGKWTKNKNENGKTKDSMNKKTFSKKSKKKSTSISFIECKLYSFGKAVKSNFPILQRTINENRIYFVDRH